MDFFSTQGQESLTWTVWCGWKSNSSKILWLCWLSARLMKIGSKVKLLSSGQHCPHYKSGKNFHRSRASNSKENSLIWPEMEFIQDFVAVLVTCKFEEHLIKNEVQATLVNSTMLNSILSLTSKWQPGPNFFPYIFIAIRLCLTANVTLLIIRIFGPDMCILMHFSLFSSYWFLMIFFFFFFFDGAIHWQNRLFIFFSNGQGWRFVGRKEQKKTSFFLSYLIS